jgi:predicted dehydrogenase
MPRIRVAVAGCGSVSGPYLRDLARCPNAEVVAVCDSDPARAAGRASEFGIARVFHDIDALLSDADFELLVNLTAVPSHFALNLKALRAGRHVLCEKPIAMTREEGRLLLAAAAEQRVLFTGAPNVVTSPAFRAMADAVANGEIGRVAVAHGRYGYAGPDWGPWFYRKGGGALFDLGVYDVTFITGLLGPARSVIALSGTAIPERVIEGERVRVEADDNTVLLLDHGDAVFSTIQTGFVYGAYHDERAIEVIGTGGSAYLLGWDWEPKGVEIRTGVAADWTMRAEDQQDYSWEHGASYIARCLATGRQPAMPGEHAYHVLDIMLGALESAETGRRIEVSSRFQWPVPPA